MKTQDVGFVQEPFDAALGEVGESDRRRDPKLSAAGWRPVRITWRHITKERAAVGRDLTAMHKMAA